MPIVREDQVNPPLRPGIRTGIRPFVPNVPEDEKLGFLDSLAPAFRINNTIGSWLADEIKPDKTVSNPEFDPFESVIGTIYEDNVEDFTYADSNEEVQAIKDQIDRENRDRKMLRDAGMDGFLAELVAGVADLPSLIPIGGAASIGWRNGGSLLKAGGIVAAEGAGAVALSEIALHSTQEARTGEESFYNIAGAAVLSGILGAGASKIAGNRAINKLGKQLEKEAEVPSPKEFDARDELVIAGNSEGEGVEEIRDIIDSVGAARVQNQTLDQLSEKGTFGIGKGMAFLTPKGRLANSPFKQSRINAESLLETGTFKKKNDDFLATSVAAETLVRLNDAGIAKALREQRASYKQLRKYAKERNMKPMSPAAFRENISKAMRRGDRDINGDDFISRAARTYRSQVFEPLKEKAIKLGLLPKDVKVDTAISYLTRVPNRKKIISRRGDFEKIVRNWITQEARLANRDIKFGKEKLSLDDLDDYIDDIVNNLIDNYIGINNGHLPYDFKIAERGPLKERTFNIPDELIEDFLENDIEIIAERYTRTMGADIALTEKFGDVNMSEAFRKLKDEYIDLQKKAKTEAEKNKLYKIYKSDVKDLETTRDLLRGTYGLGYVDPESLWGRGFRSIRTVQYMALMGGVLFTSIPDIGNVIAKHGFVKLFKDDLIPRIRQINAIKMSKIEAIESAAAVEGYTARRLQTLAEIGDPYSQNSAFERFMANAANLFTRSTLINNWNDFWKNVGTNLAQQRIIRLSNNVLDGKNIAKKDKAFLAQLGIDVETAKSIAEQVRKYGIKEGELTTAHSESWDNTYIREIWRAALNKNSSQTILIKSVGDVPLAMNTETGKVLTQFTSFAFAAIDKIFLSALQQRDASAAAGIISQIALGTVVYALKQKASGKEISDDPGVLLSEGLDRSGFLAILMHLNGIAERFSMPGVTTGIHKAFGSDKQPLTRWQKRNRTGALVGPTFGFVENIGNIADAIGTEEANAQTVRAIRRITPWQNHLLLRNLADKVQESVIDKLE